MLVRQAQACHHPQGLRIQPSRRPHLHPFHHGTTMLRDLSCRRCVLQSLLPASTSKLACRLACPEPYLHQGNLTTRQLTISIDVVDKRYTRFTSHSATQSAAIRPLWSSVDDLQRSTIIQTTFHRCRMIHPQRRFIILSATPRSTTRRRSQLSPPNRTWKRFSRRESSHGSRLVGGRLIRHVDTHRILLITDFQAKANAQQESA